MILTIDSIECDLAQNISLPSLYNATSLSDVESRRKGASLKISLPRTTRNDEIMAFAADLHAKPHFNDSHHYAEFSHDHAVLFGGVVRLLKLSDTEYNIEIRGGAAQWAKNVARRMFNDIDIDYSSILTPTEIYRSWTDNKPVIFLPIQRDEYAQQNSSIDLLPVERILSVDDYHPFLSVETLVEAIFSDSGYTLKSNFAKTDLFRSLLISGAYPSHDADAQEAKMGFFAQRTGTATATADIDGRVYADTTGASNMVGNIVATATPQSLDEDGKVIADLYNNGGCLGMNGKNIVFRPRGAVSVGFEYRLRYTTSHRILTRDRLRGFDSVFLGAGGNMTFTLANRYVDQRDAVRNNFTYRAIVFNHSAGTQYRITYSKNGVAGAVWGEFSTRSGLTTSPTSGTITNPLLQVKSGSNWIAYSGDWALYQGYIGETGETAVELRVRTAAELLAPSSPKYFNTIFFSGAEQGMTLKLHKECSLRPVFSSSLGLGSPLKFADVAQHRVRQSEFIDAIGHLFNLKFYTDEVNKTVYMEPHDSFYDESKCFDWSNRIDLSQPIEVSDIALDIHKSRTFGYQDTDGTLRRMNTTLTAPFGEWTTHTDSFAAIEGEQKLTNPMFTPTLNIAGFYTDAPSALIMQVCDRDDATTRDNTNFSARIVSYCGMKSLPPSERWGYPSGKSEYPLAAFHHTDATINTPFTLCFEDRDGIKGLHRFYDKQIAQQNKRQLISLSLLIEPQDIDTLFSVESAAPNIRSIFVFDIDGEAVRCTLHAIGGYNPKNPSTKCIFSRLIND